MIGSIKDSTLLNNGLKMPWLGFGVFKISDGQEVEQAVSYALEAGYRSIDTAAVYRNERGVGKAIRENKHWYYLDDGLYGSLSGQVFDHAKYQFKVTRNGRRQLSTLAGPTCDSLDIIAVGEDLPELEIGDIVYVENVGAYSTATATNFNGLSLAKIVMVP